MSRGGGDSKQLVWTVMAWGSLPFSFDNLCNGCFVYKLTSDICEELCIEVTEVKRFGGSEGVVPPVADMGLVDEKGPLADLIGSMPPVMGTKCHPKL